MARSAMEYDTRTKTARAKLDPRPKPYFRQIAPGKTLGYIRRETGSGSWIVRDKEGGKYRTRIIGHADDLDRADGRDVLTYEQAMAMATGHTAPLAVGGRITVETAMDRYLTALAAKSKHAKEYRGISDRRIVPALGGYRVDRLTKTQIEEWLAGLVREEDPDDPDARRRSQDTANRVLTHLKAGLNAAFADEANGIATDAAWRRVKPYRNVSRPREVDLSPEEVQAFIDGAATFDQALAYLIEAGYLTGARMGELASASVRDLDGARRTLHVDGKTGARTISLTEETAAFLQERARGKKRTDPLLPQADGTRWPRTGHFRSIKRAAKAADLPPDACFYSLRHAHISRAIEAGMPLSLIAENCGTSLLMIQRNYAKVLAKTRAATIEKTAPKLRLVK